MVSDFWGTIEGQPRDFPETPRGIYSTSVAFLTQKI